jgi:hypothetical protein
MKAAAKPANASWLWTLAYGQHKDRTPTHSYEATREAAMAAFDPGWIRTSDLQLRRHLVTQQSQHRSDIRARFAPLGAKNNLVLSERPCSVRGGGRQ